MIVVKRNGTTEEFSWDKIYSVISNAFKAVGENLTDEAFDEIKSELYLEKLITVEEIQDQLEQALFECGHFNVMKAFILYREKHKHVRDWVNSKEEFINRYKVASNTANATIDDNSNVTNKNIGILNTEIHKEDNIKISRGMIVKKLKQLYPYFDSNNYIKDLEGHIIYKHDESSFAGAIAPYCCSITMYPFLIGGIKGIGGLSASPKNLDSYCGMYINLIFATSAMFAGAVATSEFLLYFDYFARKEWGDDYYKHFDTCITSNTCKRQKTIQSQIHQYFQQVIYSINQPAAARGMQSASKIAILFG